MCILIRLHEIGERAQVEFLGHGSLRLLQQPIDNAEGFSQVGIVADRYQRERMDERYIGFLSRSAQTSGHGSSPLYIVSKADSMSRRGACGR